MKTSKTNSTEKTEEYDKRMDTLFSRFAAIYGHVWVSSYPTVDSLTFAKKEWSSGLRRFDNLALKEALIDCRNNFRYPPTLPEFIACCKEKIARRKTTTLEKSTIQPAELKVAEAHIKAMLDGLTRK